jgi:phage gp29-like protein
MVLRNALAGSHVQQWELFDLMLDSWPELAACAQELTYGVSRLKPIFEPFAEEGEEATPEAIERAKLVSSALRRMAPDATADENDLDGTLKDIIDGWFRGVACLEIEWQTIRSPLLGAVMGPRSTTFVHPSFIGWNQEGRLGLRVDERGNLLGMRAGTMEAQGALTRDFPPHKFLIGIHKAKSGSALGGALLRPLAWWWCAANFSADWLLNLAQVFGLPFRWANYDPTAPQETVDRICSMLQNMGSAGWAAFPAGTTMELKEASGKTGDGSPQGELLDRADRYARLLVLGQTLSGSQDASKGGGKAFGEVESDVKAQRVEAASNYACRVINTQLIPSILILNYGDAAEAPTLRLLGNEEGSYEEAQRDEILGHIMPLSAAFLRKKYGQPEPRDDQDRAGGKHEENAERTRPNVQCRMQKEKEKEKEKAAMKARIAGLLEDTDDAIFSRELRELADKL